MNANLSQQDKLTNNNDINKRINNDTFIKVMTQLVIPQITKNSFEEEFFNGSKFHNKNDFESLILPAGCSGSILTFP